MDEISEAIKVIVKAVRVPKSQKASGGDQVMWKQEGEINREWGNNIYCFGGSVRTEVLTKHSFECRSFQKGKYLPQKVYLGTMRELRQCGLISPGMQYWIKSRHARFAIPLKDYDRHSIFTALSLYRHCDAQPNIMYLAWRLYDRLWKYQIPYLQCLHYALGTLAYTGHTFISMGSYNGAMGAQNPACGWAMAYFGTLSFEQRAALESAQGDMTTTMFALLASQVSPALPPTSRYGYIGPAAGEPTADGSGVPAFTVPEKVQLLHPQLSPLYKYPQKFATPEAFAKVVEGLCQDRKATEAQTKARRSQRGTGRW
jgi:hypothetical protein